ncbi:ELMO/CED-12 family-domain-containing protein, partial [Blastocladiella britannica]
QLWTLVMPTDPLTGRISGQWSKIGFQGTDPATDFRGMGLHGLDDLVYIARAHPTLTRRLLDASHHPISWYSWAIVGINISSFVVSMLRTRRLQYLMYHYGPTQETVAEFYCSLRFFYLYPSLSGEKETCATNTQMNKATSRTDSWTAGRAGRAGNHRSPSWTLSASLAPFATRSSSSWRSARSSWTYPASEKITFYIPLLVSPHSLWSGHTHTPLTMMGRTGITGPPRALPARRSGPGETPPEHPRPRPRPHP